MALLAEERVPAGAAAQPSSPPKPIRESAAAPAGEQVVAEPARDHVAAALAEEPVAGVAAPDHVVAAPSADEVG